MTPSPTDGLDIPAPVAAFIDAVNRHDEQGFLDALGDDGLVDDWGRRFEGRAAITAWSDVEFIGANGTMTPERIERDGDDVTVIADWRSTHANGLSRFTFHLEDERITSMTIREG